MIEEYLILALLLIAGFFAGVINALSGSGSVFTLGTMLFLGIPVHLANGTNRLGALVSSFTSLIPVWKDSSFQRVLRENIPEMIITVIFSMIGAYGSSHFSVHDFEQLIGWVMVGILVMVLGNPKKMLRDTAAKQRVAPQWRYSILAIIAMYAGLIQLGMGIMYLSAGVLVLGYTATEANFLKLILTVFMIIPAFSYYVWKGQVDWHYSIVLALGQGSGGFLASKYLLLHPSAKYWVRALLIVMIGIVVLKLLVWQRIFA